MNALERDVNITLQVQLRKSLINNIIGGVVVMLDKDEIIVEEELDNIENENEDLCPIDKEELLVSKYTNGQFRIVRSNMDFPLNNLEQVLSDSSYMKINPSYQRRNRWDVKKKSLLIESLLMNVPIPPIFLYEKDYNSYEVMDGLQRLKTIHDFLSNKFKLTSLEYWEELNGRYFKGLPDILKRGLYRRTISAIVLLAETSKKIDETDIRTILFNRLNTGGVQLNPQEIRNALFPGSFNDLIIKLSREKIFTDVWKIPPQEEDEENCPSDKLKKNNLFKTMKDCEIVLRYFAIKDVYLENKRGKLNRLLDECMKKHQNDSEEIIESLYNEYVKNLESLKEIFGDKLFYLPSVDKLSIPMYDSFMVAYNLVDGNTADKEDIILGLENALNDIGQYETLIGKRATSQSIRDRVDLAVKILAGENK